MQFSNASDLQYLYLTNVLYYHLSLNTSTPTAGACPQETPYRSAAGGSDAGRVVCVGSGGNRSAEIIWSNDKLRILGDAVLSNDPYGSGLVASFQSRAGRSSGQNRSRPTCLPPVPCSVACPTPAVVSAVAGPRAGQASRFDV